MPQRVLERALLGRDLRAGVEVLQRAAAADAEMRATRIDARRVRLDDRLRARELVRRLALERRDGHGFARQRALDEDRLAVDARDAAPFLIERIDGRDRSKRTDAGRAGAR
jgi:hypothetical protein